MTSDPTQLSRGDIEVDHVSITFTLPDGRNKLAVDDISVSTPRTSSSA